MQSKENREKSAQKRFGNETKKIIYKIRDLNANR